MLEELRGHDAILLGAVGDPTVPSGVLERGLLLRLRFAFDHHVNLRPARLYPGVAVAAGRRAATSTSSSSARAPRARTSATAASSAQGTPHEIATEVSVNTAYGVERVVRDAFRRAAARPRQHLTLVHKTNVLVNAGDLWARTVAAVAQEFPDVTTDYLHVDAASIFMVTQPERFDVIVTDNLFGDILTDLAAAITGGIGLAASGNLDVSGTQPVDVRAGARLGTRHRRAGHRRPDRDDPVGGACCSSSSACRRRGDRRRGGRRRRPGRARGRLPAYAPREVGDAVLARL